MATQKDNERAESQAKAQLESVKDMMKRLEHVRECNGDNCTLTDKELYAGINLFYTKKLTRKQRDEAIEQYHDEDAAISAINEDPLSVQVRSDWHTPGEQGEDSEYEILLCTGGPAVRIVGDLDGHGQPDSARLQYQDWFTPWVEYITNGDDHDAILAYAQYLVGL